MSPTEIYAGVIPIEFLIAVEIPIHAEVVETDGSRMTLDVASGHLRKHVEDIIEGLGVVLEAIDLPCAMSVRVGAEAGELLARMSAGAEGGVDDADAPCPKCDAWVSGAGEFGVVRHEACGYCAHPSRDFDDTRSVWTCALCGDEQLDHGDHPNRPEYGEGVES